MYMMPVEQFTNMVRPQCCCPCGSPVYTQQEASPKWLFTHANCTRMFQGYSTRSTNASRSQTYCPSDLYTLRLRRPQFVDSEDFTMSLRPSQFYTTKPAPKGGSSNPPSGKNLRADTDKSGKTVCGHGTRIWMDLQFAHYCRLT